MEKTVTNNAVAIICDGIDISQSLIKPLVNAALLKSGLRPWSAVEAEVFTYGTKSLIMARPARARSTRLIHLRRSHTEQYFS